MRQRRQPVLGRELGLRGLRLRPVERVLVFVLVLEPVVGQLEVGFQSTGDIVIEA
jgi:hypothetical protein